MMKKLQKQNLIVKVALLAVFIYAVKYLLKQLNIAILDSQYLEGFMDKKTFVFFKMNGCPHCEKMQGEWNKFVRNNRSGVATKELEASANQALAEKYNVQGYPTLLLVNGDKVLATYDGERKAEAFESFVSNN